MKIAFARLFGGEETYENVLDQSGIAAPPSESDTEFSDNLLEGLAEKREELDGIIDGLTVDWSLDRLPKVDLCILRIAVYEMCFVPDLPVGVSINEAVELAKTFGDDNSPAYINGILGSLARRLDTQTHG